MSRRCTINGSKAVMFGNNVSHSNRKTRRRFLPNMQSFSLMSEALGGLVKMDMTAHGVRTVEHNHGLDLYLLSTPNSKLTEAALTLKKRIQKVLAKKEALEAVSSS